MIAQSSAQTAFPTKQFMLRVSILPRTLPVFSGPSCLRKLERLRLPFGSVNQNQIAHGFPATAKVIPYY